MAYAWNTIGQCGYILYVPCFSILTFLYSSINFFSAKKPNMKPITEHY